MLQESWLLLKYAFTVIQQNQCFNIKWNPEVSALPPIDEQILTFFPLLECMQKHTDFLEEKK